MRKFVPRSKFSLVVCAGYVKLSDACIRANKDGYFGLSQRVAPESFDGKDTNIDPRECFFGGRRVELALQAQKAEDFATRSVKSTEAQSASDGPGVDSNE